MRDLVTVLDAVMKLIPQWADHLRPTRESARFAAPEMQPWFWAEAMDILTELRPKLTIEERAAVRAILQGD